MGIRQAWVLPQNPRANGLVERYNGLVVTGLRRMLAACPEAHWTEVLGEVVAGLRFLPNRAGFQPYVAVFKQYPTCLMEAYGRPLSAPDFEVDG